MLRRPLVLAALAHSAVPRLHPVSVHGTTTRPGAHYQVALVVTDDDRTWDVKVALSAAAGAALEQSDALTRLLAKRLPYAVPRLEGLTVTSDGDTVAVLPHLPGEATTWRTLEAGGALARSVGKALAALHDIDPRVVEESGLPTYDADAYRARKLAGLDRAAITGHVPAGLLGRWERALEEVTLWKFATCTTHGPLESADVLVDGGVTAIIGWEHAGVSDPAEDFAPLSVLAPSGAFDTVIESYAGARRDAPDPHLSRRIRLAAELQRVTALMDAVAADDDELVHRRAAALRRLDEETEGDEGLLPSTPGRRRPRPGDAAQQDPVDPADIRVVDLHDTGDEDETVEIPLPDEEDPANRSNAPGSEKSERVARTPQPSKKPSPPDETADDAEDDDQAAPDATASSDADPQSPNASRPDEGRD
ncbi:phosphotransferase [Leekyejoonella antrihumi]|uniref:Aminoglycoside phosphotransferase n=1 Tax=Leekyejoonella antrihumi TaxID=1660198 RepID=A0A563DYM1_9MICO|nr:phosphotransferase [Leekyejoonella antrihumi]TWP35317.1 aminoglycoside phosphotransferase [Leekyejoonella antrihumi]